MNNKCVNKECVKYHEESGEDIKLRLTIKETLEWSYKINADGTLQFYDRDTEGQDHTIHCPLCGTNYEFDFEFGYISEQHVLPGTKGDIDIRMK